MEHVEDKKVKDLMTYGVITVPEYAKVINIIKILSEGHIHGVVVVGKEGESTGMVSEIDIPKAFNQDLGEVTAKEIMSKPVRSIDGDETIANAAQIMRENSYDRLVILDKNNFPKGIISITDIIREISDSYFK